MFAQASVAVGRIELRASELEGWIRKRHAPMRAPGAASLSSRPRHESTTGGARADRVGVKLSSRAIVSRRARRRKPPSPWPVKPRLESRQIVTGLGPWRFQCSLLRASWKARPHPGSEHEGDLIERHRGSGDRQHVLADCFGCRSRRATLGPRVSAGLAPRHHEGNLRNAWSERAPEAGSRRQSRENGGGPSKEGTRQMEGALVRSSRCL